MIKKDSKKTKNKLMEDLFKKLLLEDGNCDKRVESDSEKERLEDFEGYDCTWDSANEEYCCKKIKKDKDEKKDKEEKKKKEEKQKIDLKKKYQSTGLSKDEGNKFREWMSTNHSDFKDENGEKLDKKGEPDNGTIRQAWSKYKDEYQEKSPTTDDVTVDDDKPEKPNRDDFEDSKIDSFYKIDCEPWDEVLNYFYEDFPTEKEAKAEEFYDWLSKNYGSHFLSKFKVSPGCVYQEHDWDGPFLRRFADATYVKDPKLTNYEAWKRGEKIRENKKMKKTISEDNGNKKNYDYEGREENYFKDVELAG